MGGSKMQVIGKILVTLEFFKVRIFYCTVLTLLFKRENEHLENETKPTLLAQGQGPQRFCVCGAENQRHSHL